LNASADADTRLALTSQPEYEGREAERWLKGVRVSAKEVDVSRLDHDVRLKLIIRNLLYFTPLSFTRSSMDDTERLWMNSRRKFMSAHARAHQTVISRPTPTYYPVLYTPTLAS
jgi:hypothetical protein